MRIPPQLALGAHLLVGTLSLPLFAAYVHIPPPVGGRLKGAKHTYPHVDMGTNGAYVGNRLQTRPDAPHRRAGSG